MLKIRFSKDAEKALRHVHPKHQRQMALKIAELRQSKGMIPDEKKLKGYPYKRIDVGEYRIIYEIEGGTLSILLVGKRNDDEIYRKFSRKVR